MQSLGRVLAQDTDRSAWSDFWYTDPGSSTSAGTRVTADSVMGIPAVYACVTVISEDIAKMPLQMFEDLGAKGRRRASNHPIDDVISEEPNPYQTGVEFKEMMQAFSFLRKFGIAEIKPGPRGAVDTLWPLHPDLVTEERVISTGAPRYIYRDPKKGYAERVILAEDAMVLRGRQGRSVLDFARDSLGLELAMDRYQGFLFSRGMKASGVVSHPKVLQDPLRAGIRKALDEHAIGGPRAGRPLLLEDGMTWQNVSISPRDAQFEQIRSAGLKQVCRWFRMKPSKIADIDDYHYATIEGENIYYVTDTLLGPTVRWEQVIRRDLIVNKSRFFARFNLDGLLRGDSQARASAYEIAIRMRWMSRNEVRAKENMNPVEGGDEFDMFPASGANPVPTVGALTPLAKGHLKLIASGVAERLVRREYAAITKLGARTTGQQFRDGVETFYGEHADEIARDLVIPKPLAIRYAREQRMSILADGPQVMETWLEERVAHLTELAMDKPEMAA